MARNECLLSACHPGRPVTTLRHIAAFPNCRAAHAVGLASAYRGEPGYWQRHDRDADGIACEPWSPRDLKPRLLLPRPLLPW